VLTNSKRSIGSWRRRVGAGALLAAVAGVSVGFTMVASASGGGNTTNVNFVPLSPAFKLETAKVIATNGTVSAVVIGGSTKIPTNATTVDLSLTGSGASAGSLDLYPAGNPSAGPGAVLSWNAGEADSVTAQVNVGLSDEVTFQLNGPSAKLTATITGYSTQVTDGDVSGLDGSAGQVLTNNGNGGATWQPSSDGGGIAAGATQSVAYDLLSSTEKTIVTLPVSPGSYLVTLTGSAKNFSTPQSTQVACQILATTNSSLAFEQVDVAPSSQESLAMQQLMDTSPYGNGTITVQCSASSGNPAVGNVVLVAQKMATVSGNHYQ
jgi:hypothetical protein